LQPYPIVAADALFAIDTAVILAVLSLDEYLLGKKTLSVSRNFDASQCVVVIFSTALPGYELLNALRTAVDDFYAK
jgi:hypothetical protein